MPRQVSIHVLDQRRQAKLRQLSAIGPVLQGSLATIGVTCGNPQCRCAQGDKHTSHILTKKVRGKTKTTYVPVDLVEEAQAWTRNFRQVKQLLTELSALSERMLKLHVPSRRARARNLAVGQRRAPASR